MFHYAFKTMEGVEVCGLETSKYDFDETKMEDEKYIRKFLKKHTSTFLKSCKIIDCQIDCEWFVKITVDLKDADIRELIDKEMDISLLNYLVTNIGNSDYENLLNVNGHKLKQTKEKLYRQGFLCYKNKTKIYFEQIEDNKKGSYALKITKIEKK